MSETAGPLSRPPGRPPAGPASPSVRLLLAFLDSAGTSRGDDVLARPDDAERWCRTHGLLPAGLRLSAVDLHRLVSLREGLRDVLRVHSGLCPDADGVRVLNEVLDEVPFRIAFLPDGDQRLVPMPPEPFTVTVAGLLEAVQVTRTDGDWERLKVCNRSSCRRGFYDGSRNRSGRWCSMSRCGNQAKMARAHEARRERIAE